MPILVTVHFYGQCFFCLSLTTPTYTQNNDTPLAEIVLISILLQNFDPTRVLCVAWQCKKLNNGVSNFVIDLFLYSIFCGFSGQALFSPSRSCFSLMHDSIAKRRIHFSDVNQSDTRVSLLSNGFSDPLPKGNG